MSHRTRILSYTLLIGLCSLATIHAANVRWSGQGGNSLFHNTGNWTGGLIPGVIDVAQFGRSVQFLPQTYTVSFNNNATNQAIHIEDDNVTFDLNSRVYTVTAADGVLVGLPGNFAGRLTVTDGTLASSTKIDVGAATNRVGFLTVGLNGLISGAANLNVGKLATGTLTVQAGGDISTTGTTTIGDGATGTATISGDSTVGSASLLTGALNVGTTGNGTVNVQLGGLLQNSGAASIGSAGTGTVNVMNLGTVWNSQGLLEVGNGGTGEVNITIGGKLTSLDAIVGADVSNSGEVNVDGTSSLWDNSGTLTVGGLGNGALNITSQGAVDTMEAFIGFSNNGMVNVSGAGSLWTIAEYFEVGRSGTGTLNISGGGTVLSNNGNTSFISRVRGGSTVSVDGTGSVWETGHIDIGSSGGTLTVSNGGTVRTLRSGLIDASGTGATVTVSGLNSKWEIFQPLSVGSTANGMLDISGGGKVKSSDTKIGASATGVGHVTVDGVGSVWEYSASQVSGDTLADLIVGDQGDGTIEIMNSGQLRSTASSGSVINEIGSAAGSNGVVRVTGPGSLWNTGDGASGHLIVGKAGAGTLEVLAGGAVQTDRLEIGVEAGANGTVTVSGADSLLSSPDLRVGNFTSSDVGQGALNITNGGRVESANVSISGPLGSPGIITVDGPGSRLETLFDLNVGLTSVQAEGMLAITGGAGVTAGVLHIPGEFSPKANGNVIVAGSGSRLTVPGRVAIGVFDVQPLGIADSSLSIQAGATVSAFQIEIFRHGMLSLLGGTLSTTAIIFQLDAFADHDFEWTSGTLNLGVGGFDGDLINQAGTLAPVDYTTLGNVAIGSTIVEGDYVQLSAATLQIEIGGSTSHDSLEVTQDAFLGGELELILLSGFTPSPSDTFTVMTVADDLFDVFDNVAGGQRLTTSDGLGSFLVNYGPGSPFDPKHVVLSNFLPSAGLPGDFDLDGDVDGRDFLVWQRNPGVGNLADWQANYGVPFSATSIAVPEPAARLIFFFGMASSFLSCARPMFRRFVL